MQALVEFTASSFSTAQPSPFGSSIYELESGRLVSAPFDLGIAERFFAVTLKRTFPHPLLDELIAEAAT